MGMITYRQAIPSAVGPSRLFNAFFVYGDNVLPKIVPQWIKSVELIKGDGGVGSIKKTNFGENMGTITYKQEISSVIAPSRLFKALFLYADNVLPKIVPKWIKSVELIEGDGGVGSIKKTNFGESSDIKYAKYKIGAGSFPRKYTMIESNIMFDKIDEIEKEVKLVAAGSGCICKMTIEYHVKEHRVLTRADINRDKDRAVRFFRAVEKYLLDNPNVCA